MSTSVSVVKLTNIFRGRWAMMVHELTEKYKPTITRNKDKLMDVIREKAEIAAKSGLAKQIKVLKGFYTVEMAPPGPTEMKKLLADVALAKEFYRNKCYLYITVKQAWLLFLVGLEVVLWFFLGETIGKGHIVGYLV